MTLLPTNDNGNSCLHLGRCITRPNDPDTNPLPPDDSKFCLHQPPTNNNHDTNPPPPGESEFDFSQPTTGKPQLSQSLLSDDADAFTVIGRTHEGRSTNSPRNATVMAIALDTVPNHNTFGPLADSDTSTVDSDIQPPKNMHDCNDVDTPTQRIDELFCDADATLAAATLNFNLVKERLRVRLDRDLTQSITTKTDLTGAALEQSMGESLSLFITNI